jgi:hypothetical protein
VQKTSYWLPFGQVVTDNLEVGGLVEVAPGLLVVLGEGVLNGDNGVHLGERIVIPCVSVRVVLPRTRNYESSSSCKLRSVEILSENLNSPETGPTPPVPPVSAFDLNRSNGLLGPTSCGLAVQLSTAIMPTNSKLGVEERVMVTKVSVISGMYVIETSVTVEVAEVLRAFGICRLTGQRLHFAHRGCHLVVRSAYELEPTRCGARADVKELSEDCVSNSAYHRSRCKNKAHPEQRELTNKQRSAEIL